jgi:hypothetical protein
MRTAVGKVLTPVSRRGTDVPCHRSDRPWSPSRVQWPAAACGDVLTHRWTNPPSPRRPALDWQGLRPPRRRAGFRRVHGARAHHHTFVGQAAVGSCPATDPRRASPELTL